MIFPSRKSISAAALLFSVCLLPLQSQSVSCVAGKGLPLDGVRGRVLVELVEVEPDEELFELAFLRQVAHDLVHEAGVVPERVGDVQKLLLGLAFSADIDSVAAHNEMEFENELEDLVESDLQALVSRSC